MTWQCSRRSCHSRTAAPLDPAARKDVRLNWLNLKKLKLKKQTAALKKRRNSEHVARHQQATADRDNARIAPGRTTKPVTS
jgi:ribosomal protein L14E/L6E/L27E